MPFSFLNPWFWLGAVAVAAPIWLHLRRRREKNLFRFSAVRFLEDQPHPKQAPLRLRDWLLFLLRALALVLIIAAFAWPYLRGANTMPVKESRVYLLDNTLSHQALDGSRKDRDRVLAEISRLGTDVQVAVVELNAVPRVLVSFGDDREAARQKLSALQPSFQRGSYLAAFRQANGLLANSLGQEKRIVFLGDGQENQWTENASTPPFLKDVKLELPHPAEVSLPNVSLSDPRAQRVFLGDKSEVHFTVKLTHTGPAQSANLVLKSNGQVIFNTEKVLENEPETILLQGKWEADPREWVRGEITAEANPDALAADNRVFFSLPPVVEGKVALLAQSSYLKVALSPDIMRGEWSTRVLQPSGLNSELAADQDAEVLCIESHFLQSPEARKLLWRYVTNGRGVLLFVNRLTPVIDAALRELGFETDGTVEAPRDNPEKFQFVLSNHAIFHPFLSPDYGNLMDIKVHQFARLKGAQSMPLIFGTSGAGLLFQSTRFPGRLFVAAFGADREHTSWPVHQTFIPFLDLTLQAARAQDASPTVFEPGEIQPLQVPAAVHEVVLERAQSAREESRNNGAGPMPAATARFAAEHGKAQVRMPDAPGLYEVRYDGKPALEKLLAVNPSPKESQLTFADAPQGLASWQLGLGERGKAPREQVRPARIRLAGVLQQQYWWWLVLCALLTLALEMLLAERRLRATGRAVDGTAGTDPTRYSSTTEEAVR